MIKEKNFSCYGIYISQHFETKEEVMKELKRIYTMMLRVKNSNLVFNNISFIIGASNTEKDTARICYLYNGKRGRPKKIIEGNKLMWHLHIYVISENGSPSVFCNEVLKKFHKKKYYDVHVRKNNNVNNAIIYLISQSLPWWKKGDYFYSQNFKDVINYINGNKGKS